MEEGSSSASPASSDSNPTASGTASKFLTNLPSRGLFFSTVSSSNLKCLVMKEYHWVQVLTPLIQEGSVRMMMMMMIWTSSVLHFYKVINQASYGGMRIYVCDHNTTPPDNQVIKTDQMNILIRSLTLKKQQGDLLDGSRKRASDRTADGRAPAKRTMTSSQNNGRQSASSSRATDKNFQGLTVEKLRSLLKEKGLSPKGKKDELIERLRNASK